MTRIRTPWSRYGRDIAEARARIASGSHLITTPRGLIEYADAGDGSPTILAVHGAGGGFD